MSLGDSEHRQTRVILKTLSPQWDEEYCLRMAVSEDVSQHQLLLTVWDHDVRKVSVLPGSCLLGGLTQASLAPSQVATGQSDGLLEDMVQQQIRCPRQL